MDGDGDMDVLSASYGDDKIAWYENTDGNGTFGAQQVITTLADGAQSVYASDLDGDGDMDVLSASYLDDKVAWYENTLAPPANISAEPGNGKVTLSWDPVSALNLVKYRIYRGRTPWNINLLDSVVAASPPDTFYIDTNVQNDTTYYYYVTAVDSAGQASLNSDTVSVTPTVGVTVELLAGASATSSGGNDQGYPLNTYYHDVKHQSIYQAGDLSSAGMNPGANIVAVELYPAQSPGMSLQNFRIATAWTNNPTLTSFDTTTNVRYGPASHNANDFPMGQWVRFNIDPIIWDGNEHLILEFSHDNDAWASGGGVYLHEAGPGRALRGWSDSQAGNYPFNNSMTSVSDTKVPWLRLVYTEPAALPPTNLTAIGLYGQVNLSWTASITTGVIKYYIYRETGTGTTALIDSVGADTLTYADANVNNGSTYTYAVSAKKSTGEESALSAAVSAVPQVAAPGNLTATAASRKVTLSWDAPGTGASYIKIYRGFSAANLSLVDSTSDATVTSYTDQNLANGVTYYYALRTHAQDGTESDYSSTVWATPDYLGPVWWVATTGNDAGDGSETSPFQHIQTAIDKATHGDTVRVKAGVYTGFGNYDLSFGGHNIVLMGDTVAGEVVIDVGAGPGNQHRGIVMTNAIYADSAKIKDLKIINGYTSGSDAGGAILLDNVGQMKIEGCRIGPGNWSSDGAGIAIFNTDVTITDSRIKGNHGSTTGDVNGIGLHVEFWDPGHVITLENCVINGNTVDLSGSSYAAYGGGFYISGNGNSGNEVRFLNSIIRNNQVVNNGSGRSAYGGGGYIEQSATVTFVHSLITENSASNSVDSWGAEGGGLLVDGNGTVVNILNSIVWDNNASNPGTEMIASSGSPTYQANYSDFQTAIAGTGNLNVDPLLVDPASRDYRLSDASTLIGAGIASGTTWPGQDLIPATDFLGNSRPAPVGSNPDLGPFENSLDVSPYPSKPTGLSAIAGDGQVTLEWTANSEPDIATYGIYYGIASAPGVKQAETSDGSATSYSVTGLSNNITYYFRITAIDADGYESDFSNEVNATPQYSGTDIYVDVDSINAGYTADGSTTRPYGSIQEAINAASDGNRILVKPGLYTTTGANPSVDLAGKNIVIESTDGPTNTIIDGGGSSGGHIVVNIDFDGSGVTASPYNPQMIGFTITNGAGDEHLMVINGPTYLSGSSVSWEPKFVNCRFTNTTRTSLLGEAVIRIQEASPVFDNCTFRNLSCAPSSSPSNSSVEAPIALHGSWNNADGTVHVPQFLNCVIAGNSNTLGNGVQNNGITFNGGAVFIGFGMAPSFENTRIDSNSIDAMNSPTNMSWSESNGGAIYINDYFDQSPTPIQFNNCSISGNSNTGVDVAGGAVFSRHPYVQFTNCLITDNALEAVYNTNNQSSDAQGGGIYVDIQPTDNYPYGGTTYGPTVDLINVTLANNTITQSTNGSWAGAGIYRDNTNAHFTIFNSIIAQNDVINAIATDHENMSTSWGPFGSSSLDAAYSLIEFTAEAGITGDYMLDADPGFVGNGDYSLDISSIAIGMGGASFGSYSAPATDYFGNPRPTTSYNPGTGVFGPDLGAIENSLTVSPYPNAPENLTVTDENDSTVTLTWDAPADNDIAKYRIYSDTFSPAGSLIDSAVGVTTKQVRGLTNGTTYYFRVTAVDLDGYESELSNEVTGTPRYKGPVWYVDDAVGTISTDRDGSPANPFGDIGDVFDNAPMNSGDTIMVLPGTYSDSDDRNLHAPDFPFVLMSRDGPETTIIELISGSVPKYQFFTFDQEADSSTKVIGFTIQNGGGYEFGTGNNGYNNGGAMVFESTFDSGTNQHAEVSPVIRNCRFVNNTTNAANNLSGGAVFISGASPTFEQCEFVDNTAPWNGGAVFINSHEDNGILHQAEPIFRDCLFEGNSVIDNGGDGGAIYLDWRNAIATFERCRFLNNHAPNAGGAIFSSYGGGASQPIVWVTIKNSLFAGNTTAYYGAAMVIEGQDSYVLMEHCTITENVSPWEACKMTNAFIYNSIVWNNSHDGEGLALSGLNGDVEIINSLVENGEMTPGFDATTGLVIDPVFKDTTNGDYSLSLASFALGAGLTQYDHPVTGETVFIDGLDLAGNPRISPDGSNPDLGAYESVWPATPYPDPPSDLSATSMHRSVELNWSFPAAEDVVTYYVYQSPDSLNFTPVDTVSGRFNNRTTITGLTNQEDYFYYVTAVDTADRESQPSNGVGVLPKYHGPVWYVDDDATGPLFEGSFDDPSDNIRDMIFASQDGDTILLRPGTFSGNDNRELNFQELDAFGGVTSEPRNLVLMGEYGPDSTIIDLSGFGFRDNRLLDVTSGESLDSKLVGLTILNGEANDINPIIRVEGSSLTIENCIFRDNTNTGNSGPIVLAGNNSAFIQLDKCLFENNTGTNSVGTIFADNFAIFNSVFYQNTAHLGAAIAWNPPPNSYANIVNCLFLENQSTESISGGAIWDQGNTNTSLSIYNSIFWDNISNGNDPDVGNARSGVHYCVVQNPGNYASDNFSFDPLIVDPANGDFSLDSHSPAIGLASTDFFSSITQQFELVPDLDYYGNPRPQPAGSTPDLGPIEHERDIQQYYVYHVSPVGNDNTGDGLINPFQTIQRGIDEAFMYDTVDVAPGLYTGTGNTALDFGGMPIVVRSSSGPDVTTIDCENNAIAIEFSTDETRAAMIAGFTIKQGYTSMQGGALQIFNASPTIRNMVFLNNAADAGGKAIYINGGSPQFENCIVYGNDGGGGTIYSENADPVFTHCTVVNNLSPDPSGAFLVDGGSLTVHNSIVANNTAIGEEFTDISGNSSFNVDHSVVMGFVDGIRVFSGRPSLANPAAGQFGLKDHSVAIGLADTSDFVVADILGNTRTVSDTTAPDAGAIESVLASPDTSLYNPRTWFVSPTGDDFGTGVVGDPYATIQRALNKAIWADTVRLLPGTYVQNLSTDGKDIIVQGGGDPDNTIITGTAFLFDGSPTLAGLAFRGTSVVLDMNNSNPEIHHVEISGNNGAPALLVAQHAEPVLDQVTISDNTGTLYYAIDTSLILVKNSIVWNSATGIDADGTNTFDITYSRTTNTGTGNVTVTPEFLDVNNYRLFAHSLLINAGNPADTDADGTRADMGAYPYLSFHDGPDWYVSSSGNNAGGDGSYANPFSTVQAGINFAQPGDTVFVDVGTYDGPIALREADIVLSGEYGETTLDGQNGNRILDIPAGLTSATVVENFKFTGGSALTGGAIRINGSNPVIRNNVFTGNLAGPSGSVLDISGGSPLVTYNVFSDNSGNVINVGAGAQPEIVNNTLADNSGTALASASELTPQVRNTIFWNNGTEISGTVAVTYSDIQGGVTGAGNIDSDPLFSDAAAGDYSLDLLSPCVDTGDSTDTADPDGSRRDMGAVPLYRTFVGGNTGGTNIEVNPDTSVFVDSTLIVDTNDTLFIDPGSTVYLGDGVSIIINGTLMAHGDVVDPIEFTTLYPDQHFNGIVLFGGTGGSRVDPEYDYLTISNVATGSVPLTVNGNATLNHFTIAGNDTTVHSLETDGTVTVNYSVFESSTGGTGTVIALNSFLDDTSEFASWSTGDYSLNPASLAIDVGNAEVASNIDPDFTYSDAGALYHDQTQYPVNTAEVIYPAVGDTVDVSPDTSSILGLDVFAQTWNVYDRFKTNPILDWDVNTVNGTFGITITDSSDIEGISQNLFMTSTQAGDYCEFTVSADGVTGISGAFRVVPGQPDSLELYAQTDTVMTQQDTLQIEVSVFDQFANLVQDGEEVIWSIVPLTGTGAGFSLATTTSLTENGIAANEILTDPNTALAVGDGVLVEAEANGVVLQSKEIYIVPDDIYNLSMPPALTDAPIDLSADIHSMEISATMIDTFNNPLEGVEVFWELVDMGSPDGSFDATSSFTDASGTARTTLTSGTVTGYQYQVRGVVTEGSLVAALSRDESVNENRLAGKGKGAFMQPVIAIPIIAGSRTDDESRDAIFDLDDTTAVITIIPGVQHHMVFDLVQDTVVTQFEDLPLSVTVYDQYGNTVANGTEVQWTLQPITTGITLANPVSTTTDGVATNIVHTEPTAALGSNVTVEAASGSIAFTSATITVVADDPYAIAINDTYNRYPVADTNTVDLAVTVRDTFDNVLPDIPVNWEIVEGSDGILTAATTNTDASGIAENTLTTGTLANATYRVRMWVDDNGRAVPLNLKQTALTQSALIADREIVASRRFADHSVSPETRTMSPTEFNLDDTTEVITVMAGAPVLITTNRPDTVFVVQGQTDTLVITAYDQFTNRVTDGSIVDWNPTTSSDFTIDSQDGLTTNGEAQLVLVAGATAPWLAQIDFDIVVNSYFNANSAAKTVTYRIDDVIPPAAVADLTVSPDVWTANNTFTLSWTNPVEHSGVAGAWYQIDSETPVYTASDDIVSVTLSLPANANATVALWLEDKAGNVDPSTSQTVRAKWDDIAPTTFNLTYPAANSWLNTPNPVFEWTLSSDATAGLKEYRFELDGSSYIIVPDTGKFVVPGDISEGSHSILITAVDSAGNETEMSDGSLSFNMDYTLPLIQHNQVLEGNENQLVTITASFSDPASGIARSELFYRSGGEAHWQNPVNLSSGAYQIASSFVTSTGVEYFIEAEDVAGNITTDPVTGYYSIQVIMTGDGLPSTDKWPTGIPNGTSVANYQLISFPANPANNTPTDVLVDNLGSYDNTKWRFFTYESDAWLEFAEISTIKPGVGYFLIIKDPGQNVTTGQARSVTTAEPFTINLPAGEWVMIGNPFDFEIPLSNLYTQDSITLESDANLKTWNGDWVDASSFKPWQGYIYKSATGGQLFINPRKANGGQARMAGHRDDMILNPGEWLLDIRVENGMGEDKGNQIGVLADAADGLDSRDAFEPPLVPGGVALRVDNRNWAEFGDMYTNDIRTISEEGHYWDMEVEALDPYGKVNIAFSGLNDIPAEFDVFLIDKSAGIAQNLKGRSSYVYAASAAQTVRTFRLVVGTREFVEANNAGISLYPDAYQLAQNYPNPFNPQTTIQLAMEDEAYVDLVIYNVLGEEVAILAQNDYLPAGFYNYIWNGYNQTGSRVASGMYLYSARIKDQSGKLLLNQTRKMIFVK
ncbi:MAG: fibronectin type III domain-containing protein [Fidelibacterota bacterium]